MKRIISVLLTITMLLGITLSVQLSASAATTNKLESSLPYSDQYGQWTYDSTVCNDGYKITGYNGKMSDICIPSEISNVPVLEIGDGAFYYCDSLTSITIPNGVTTIGDMAFYGCSSLTSITIPDSVINIGDDAFYGCSSLTRITIPDGVTRIGESTFLGCSSLTSIRIPDGVTTIGDEAFFWCSSLTNMTIPDSVTAIGDLAFASCLNLNDIYYTGSESEWDRILTDDYLLLATIHYNYEPPVAGDVNGDGAVALDDVIYTLKYIVGNIELTESQITNADMNNDSKVTVLDAILIQKIILG